MFLIFFLKRMINRIRQRFQRRTEVRTEDIPSSEPPPPPLEEQNNVPKSWMSLIQLAGKGKLDEFKTIYSFDIPPASGGRSPLHEAAAKGRINILQFLRSNGADLDVKDSHGDTALHLAVEASQVEAINFLIESGARTDILNDKHMAPIHVAADGGYLKSLQALVKHSSVDLNLRGEQGGTALHYCANMNTGECAKLLLKYGALPNMGCDNGFYPIHAAAKSASADTLKVLIQAAIKRGYQRDEIQSFTDKENNTPLHSAVHSGNLKVVEICLKAGAPVTVQHQDDESTPVHYACAQGNLPLVSLMYDMQPDNFTQALSLRDVSHMTPLHRAVLFDHLSVTDFLIEKGADINAKDHEGRSPLLLAAAKGAGRTVKCLLRNKADIRVKDHHNRNFLHLAIKFGGRVTELGCDVLHGATGYVNEKDDFGCTPFHYACKEGHLIAVDDLLKMGAVIDAKNNQKQTPFHFAARYGRFATCQRLLESKEGPSMINETDTSGQTALHMAAENGHTRVVSLLLQKGAIPGRDHESNTALHLAASNGYTQCMRMLLGVHAALIDVTNVRGDTALHVAAEHGHTSSVTYLMTTDAGFLQNNEGRSFFDNAIRTSRSDVAMGIVVHKRWEEALDLSSALYGCPMVGLVRHLPEVCMVVLERCQTASNRDSRRRDFYIDFNFRYLRSAMKTIIAGTPNQPFRPMPELNMMVKTGRVECLSHPVCVNFLRMKWNQYGRWYCTFYLLIYLTFLALLTAFVVTHDSMDHYDDGVIDNATIKVLHGNHAGEHYYGPVYTVFLWLIEMFAALNIVKELFQMATERWRYFRDCQNILEWVLYILILIFISPFLANFSFHWQWEIGAFVVWLAWFNCLVFLQRFDFFGIYVVMFVEILKTLLQVIIVFSILVVAFGLAFYVLMSHETSKAYSNPGLAMLRSVTMMLEMEYMDTYNEPYNDGSVVTLHYSHGTLFFMTIYVLFMPIILMNLLIGLAVGDIQGVLTNAKLQRLTLQVNLHIDLESKMPRELLLKLDRSTYRIYPNRRRNILQNMWSKVNSYEDEFSSMSDGLSLAHNKYIYIELYKHKTRLRELSDTIDKSYGILRQISQSMEIHTHDETWDEGRSNEDNDALHSTDTGSSLARQMLQQSMLVARWQRHARGVGPMSRGRGRGRGGGRGR